MKTPKIFFVRCSETTPLDGTAVRLLRTGQMFETYSEQHECVWFVSTFNHYEKRQRFRHTTVRRLGNGEIVYVRTPGYDRNLSVRRLFDHFLFGVRAAAQLRRRMEAGDICIIGMPTITAAFLAVRVCRAKGAAAVVEVRDQWPDVFWYGASGWKRSLVKLACLPLEWMVRQALQGALLVTAPSRDYREWAQRRFGVAPAKTIVSPLGYRPSPAGAARPEAAAFVQALQERAGSRRIACFFGTVGRMFDLETVVAFARQGQVDLPPEQRLYFVMLGGGDYLQHWREAVAGSSDIEFAGWVPKDVLDAVAAISRVALAPYRNTPNFEGHVPNKIMEYLSYGLPMVTCMRGEVRELVEANALGAYYTEGDVASFGKAVRQAAAMDESVRGRAKAHFQTHFEADKVYGDLLAEVQRRQADAPR